MNKRASTREYSAGHLLTTLSGFNDNEKQFLHLFEASSTDGIPTALPTRVPGTCNWIFDDPDFRKWRRSDEQSSILWVYGDAGCGKTALMSLIAEQLRPKVIMAMKEERDMHKLPVLVCSFFCDDKDADRKSVPNVLRSLLYQLFSQRADLVRSAAPHFLKLTSGSPLSYGQLWKILKNVLDNYATGYISLVIDAIDECEESERDLFVDALGAYISKKSHSATNVVKVIVSSRPSVKITDRIASQSQELLLWDKERQRNIKRDIGLLIKDRIQDLKLRTRVSKNTIANLENKLSEKANGMFLWVILVLERLKDSCRSSKTALESMAVEIPSDLESLYRMTLMEIERADRTDRERFAARALQIIVGAYRPLSIEEFRYAVAIQPEHRTLHDLMDRSESNLARFLRGKLKCLVRIYESRIYLVHQSAKDFLIRHYSTRKGVHKSHFDFGTEATHGCLSASCIAFLSLNEFTEIKMFSENMRGFEELPGMLDIPDSPSLSDAPSAPSAPSSEDDTPANPTKETPFFEYASFYWAKHFASCQDTASPKLIEAAVVVCERNTTRLDNWSEQFRRSSSDWVTLPSSLDPSLTAAYFGHGKTIDYLLNHRRHKSSTWLTDQALTWAARMGHYDIVETLLGFDSSLSDAKVESGSPLSWASRNGHAKIVELLIGKGLQINSRDSRGRAPLSLAVGHGHTEIARSLLQVPTINVDIEARNGRTPIFWTVGHESESGLELLRLLLFEGHADLKHRDCRGRTILSVAAEDGDVYIVGFLLDLHYPGVQDLLDDVGDRDGRSPLSWATYYGQITVVEMLCHSGKIDAQLYSVDHRGQNAISLAADRNHANIIRVLAKYDPYGVDRPEENGRTPLSCAVWAGNEKTVRTLLETGLAVVDSISQRGRTPLSFAVADGRRDLVRILIQGGANPDNVHDRDVMAAEQKLRISARNDEEFGRNFRLLKQEIRR